MPTRLITSLLGPITSHSIPSIPTKGHAVSFILAASQSSITAFNVLVPLLSALLGGLFVLWGTVIQSRAAERHAKQARKRDLSVESARKVDIQLHELEHVLTSHEDYSTRDLDNDAYEPIVSICAAMELHAGYIDDDSLQRAVHEAGQFLRPKEFTVSPDETTIRVTKNIIDWLRPMIQAHTKDAELPSEPPYVETYRQAYEEGRHRWEQRYAKVNETNHR